MRALITGGGGQLASDLQELLGDDARRASRTPSSTSPTRAPSTARSSEVAPDVVFNCAAFHNVDVCEREPDTSFAVNVRAVARPRAARREARAPLDELRLRRPPPSPSRTREDDVHVAAVVSTRSPSSPASTPRSPTAPTRWSSASSGLYGEAGSASKGGNFVQRMLGRAREDGAHLKMVADQRLQPTYTRDLAAALVDAVERDATGVCTSPPRARARGSSSPRRSWRTPGCPTSRSSRSRRRSRRAASTGRSTASSRARAPTRSGCRSSRPWREALDDYMARAGLCLLEPARRRRRRARRPGLRGRGGRRARRARGTATAAVRAARRPARRRPEGRRARAPHAARDARPLLRRHKRGRCRPRPALGGAGPHHARDVLTRRCGASRVGAWEAFPTERVERFVEKDGLAEFIRLPTRRVVPARRRRRRAGAAVRRRLDRSHQRRQRARAHPAPAGRAARVRAGAAPRRLHPLRHAVRVPPAGDPSDREPDLAAARSAGTPDHSYGVVPDATCAASPASPTTRPSARDAPRRSRPGRAAAYAAHCVGLQSMPSRHSNGLRRRAALDSRLYPLIWRVRRAPGPPASGLGERCSSRAVPRATARVSTRIATRARRRGRAGRVWMLCPRATTSLRGIIQCVAAAPAVSSKRHRLPRRRC